MSTRQPRRRPDTTSAVRPSARHAAPRHGGHDHAVPHGAVHAPAQVRALIAPARQEIVDVLDATGPCPVAQVAALLGRPADALYHHFRRLLKVGLVVETGRRQVGRHAFATYDLATRPMQLHRDPAAGKTSNAGGTGSTGKAGRNGGVDNNRHAGRAGASRRADLVAVMGSAQRLAWRNFSRSLAGGEGVMEGPGRTLWGARARGWLTPAALERVNVLLGELLDTLRSDGPTDGLVPISLSFLLAPAPPHRRAAAARSGARQATHPASQRTSRTSARRATPQTKGRRS